MKLVFEEYDGGLPENRANYLALRFAEIYKWLVFVSAQSSVHVVGIEWEGSPPHWAGNAQSETGRVLQKGGRYDEITSW